MSVILLPINCITLMHSFSHVVIIIIVLLDEWKSVDAYKWQKYCDGVFSRLPNVKILMSIRHVALQLVNDKSNPSTDDNIPSTEPVVLMKNESEYSKHLC